MDHPGATDQVFQQIHTSRLAQDGASYIYFLLSRGVNVYWMELWRTKKTTPESSDAVMLVDDWWFQFVVFTSNIPTNHPFLVAKRPLSSHNAYSFSRQRFCYLAQFGWDKNKWGDGKSQIGKLQETCFWRQKYTQISPVPWFCWWE